MEHDELLCELEALPRVRIDDAVEERAIAAQGQLARCGHHRLSPADVMIATLADRFALDVLHNDADFDILASKTDLAFGSIWLAERGTLQPAIAWFPSPCPADGPA